VPLVKTGVPFSDGEGLRGCNLPQVKPVVWSGKGRKVHPRFHGDFYSSFALTLPQIARCLMFPAEVALPW
jgi:hypothetical protein